MEVRIALINGRRVESNAYFASLAKRRTQILTVITVGKPPACQQPPLLGLFRNVFAKDLTFAEGQILAKILEGEQQHRESRILPVHTQARLWQAADRLTDESRVTLNKDLGERLKELDLSPA